MTRWRFAALAMLVGVLGAGCGTDARPTALAPQAGKAPSAELVVKPASSKPVVLLKGLVNNGRPLAMDLASFDALPTQRLTVLEPFVKKSMNFTGVGFADLLTAANATGKSVRIHALDDFEATLDAAALRETGVLLATRAEGKVIDIKSGGPIRLVFPPSSKTGEDKNAWVWSIDQITVQ